MIDALKTTGVSAQGFCEIVISVEQITPLKETLEQVAGWRATTLPDAPKEQWDAWHVPTQCHRIEQCLMTAEKDDTGHLRLVKFHGTDGVLMRSSQRTWDTGGIFDIDVYVKAVDPMYRALQRRGWSAFGDPVDYSWGGFDVRQSLAHTAEGLAFGMLQPSGKILIDLPDYRHMSRAFNSAQIVRDFDKSLAFYTDILGWEILVNTVVKDTEEPGKELMGIPMPLAKTTERRVAIVHPNGINDGSLEIIEMAELQGTDFSDRCAAPNLGYLAARLPVTAADTYAAAITALGGTLYTDPIDMSLAPYGTARCFSVRTPDGAILEFFEV